MLKNVQKVLFASVAVAALSFVAQANAAETTTTTVIHSSPTAVVAPTSATVEKTVTTTAGPAGKAVTTTSSATETVKTSTTAWATQEKVVLPDGTRVVAFTDFDLNHDGVLSRREVGEKLFKMYDTDGNEVIDNIEFTRKAVITVHPIEKETVVTYDFDGDGIADKTQITNEQFMRDTLLARFDENKNGLSAEEFTGRHFMEADINNDKTVDMKEFKASYDGAIDKSLKMKAETNK